jgi:hypothetical protein
MLILTVFPWRVRERDGGVLGQDGDAALAFEVVGIHHALGHLLVLAEGVRLAQQKSTRVVLPWSTWAMMAMFRRSVRCSRRIGVQTVLYQMDEV